MSQTNRILLWLREGRAITSLVALRKFGCFRLAARIKELRGYGIPIETTIRKRGDKRFASYKMAANWRG